MRFLVFVIGLNKRTGRGHAPAPLPGENGGEAPPGRWMTWEDPVAQKPQADQTSQLAAILCTRALGQGMVHQFTNSLDLITCAAAQTHEVLLPGCENRLPGA